ncbi:CDP-alcohol phosphatidyltransferase family protein [Methanobrevibacter sp. TMH8]|uniref:archaetidylinositol phosphate synthase n=1 Tax=Methanobrevibacter sp. TMH8 TaxID=2848611 RepID=UPI001CCECC99|nr:archaetidylinositol phosphate synthase [Methanobrevibacter sp. TMH8]MBZ9570779.1 CDP-alcohol phosphatidyltransferase family protein [Methanobrevibacter sp. TMH8]
MLERFRPLLKKILEPIAKQMNINPNIITLISPFIAVISALFFGTGNLLIGGLFILFSGIFDVLDGAIARYHNRSSDFGAFLDSTMDRFSDAIIIIGLMWGGYTTWLIGALAIHSAITVSYVRASAESKGIPCNVGIAERATRLIILVIGAFIAVIFNNNMLMNWAVLLMVILAYITVVQRIYHVWKLTSHERRHL